jgi:hypothetical protein
MNIRDAILKAADHIERNPGEFNFGSTKIPDGPGCGTPGCALGWIGAFCGVVEAANKVQDIDSCYYGWRCIALVCSETDNGKQKPLMRMDSGQFYARMSGLVSDWMCRADACARALRLYADKYHPAESPAVPVAFPDWMAIARGDVKCVEGV